MTLLSPLMNPCAPISQGKQSITQSKEANGALLGQRRGVAVAQEVMPLSKKAKDILSTFSLPLPSAYHHRGAGAVWYFP